MKIRYKMPKQDDCCTHYHGSNKYSIGYVIAPCFRVAICEDCGDPLFIGNSLCAAIFTYLLSWLVWNGDICVQEEGYIKQGDYLIKEDDNARTKKGL